MNKPVQSTHIQHENSFDDFMDSFIGADVPLKPVETVLNVQAVQALSTDAREDYNTWSTIMRAYERITKQLAKLPDSQDIAEHAASAESGLRWARARANALAYQSRKSKKEAPADQQP